MNTNKQPTLNKNMAGSKLGLIIGLLCSALILIVLISLSLGAVKIPVMTISKILIGVDGQDQAAIDIVMLFRLPRIITASIVGAALGVCGLQMQTLFRNPLADPFVLGISSGATLGVALVVLTSTGGIAGLEFLSNNGLGKHLSHVSAAVIGAGALFSIILIASHYVRNNMTLLILGMMTGYATGALVTVLMHFSDDESVKGFIMWTFASFGGVTWCQLKILAPVIVVCIIFSMFLCKPLNALLLGEYYAESMGVSIKRIRIAVIAVASLMAGVVTAFCGPVAFIGIAIPHLTKALLKTSDHRFLIPGVIIIGAIVTVLADMISQVPLPLNAVTSLIGAPVVIYVIIKRQQLMESTN